MNRTVLLAFVGVLITLMVGMAYVVAQQSERLGADDTGWRLASQVAAELGADSGPGADGHSDTLATLPRVDLATSFAPFVVVFDATDAPVAGNGYLDGALATVPNGVIDTARVSGSNHVTWQPAEGLRFATVELKVGDSVVLAGQSLVPSETRTDSLALVLLTAWLGLLGVAGIGVLVASRFGVRRHASSAASGSR